MMRGLIAACCGRQLQPRMRVAPGSSGSPCGCESCARVALQPSPACHAPALPPRSSHSLAAFPSPLALCPCSERKNVNLPGVVVDLPTLTDKDVDDLINWALPNDIDFIAASFVRKGSDIDTIRQVRWQSQHQGGPWGCGRREPSF